MTQVVPIHLVTPNNRDTRTQTFVNKMANVLRKQGQIEPLQVNSDYVTFEQDVYGSEILLAARMLGWSTILVTVVPRYIP